MMQNENSQFLTLNELDSLFGSGRACVGLSMKGVVAQIKGEVF
jgi:hypothetical protein